MTDTRTPRERPRAVVFDLDGTLADTLEDIADAMNRVLRRRGLPVHDYAAYRRMIGKGLRNLVAEAIPPARRDDQAIAATLADMLADYGRHLLVKTRLYDGVGQMLHALRVAQVPMAVCSNKADELTRRIVLKLVAPGTFSAVMGARPGLPLKPDPASALLAAGRLGAAPERVAYVGDSDVDMLTAVNAGMVPVGVSWGFRSRRELVEAGATMVLDRPRELLDLFA